MWYEKLFSVRNRINIEAVVDLIPDPRLQNIEAVLQDEPGNIQVNGWTPQVQLELYTLRMCITIDWAKDTSESEHVTAKCLQDLFEHLSVRFRALLSQPGHPLQKAWEGIMAAGNIGQGILLILSTNSNYCVALRVSLSLSIMLCRRLMPLRVCQSISC